VPHRRAQRVHVRQHSAFDACLGWYWRKQLWEMCNLLIQTILNKKKSEASCTCDLQVFYARVSCTCDLQVLYVRVIIGPPNAARDESMSLELRGPRGGHVVHMGRLREFGSLNRC
jgi:hypothetical protein